MITTDETKREIWATINQHYKNKGQNIIISTIGAEEEGPEAFTVGSKYRVPPRFLRTYTLSD